MMSRPQFHPETLVRNINMRTYIDRFGYRHAKERAWMDTVGLMYEELEYYISAPGTPDDILHELKPKARRMKVDTLSGGYRVGFIKGGMIADIFEEKEPKAKTCPRYNPCPICSKCMNKASHLYVACQICNIPICSHTYKNREDMIKRDNFIHKISKKKNYLKS